MLQFFYFFFSSRRRHTRLTCDWSSDVCSSDLGRDRDHRAGLSGRPADGCRRARPHEGVGGAMDVLAPLVLLAPLTGFLVNALLGRLLPRRLVGWVGAGSIGLALVFALVILSQVLGGQKLDQSYFTWWQSADFNVPFNLYVDALSTLMILVITGVGFLIHVYSIGYMREDAGFSRFFAYMNLFVFSMLLLVLSGNLVWLIIGWALV